MAIADVLPCEQQALGSSLIAAGIQKKVAPLANAMIDSSAAIAAEIAFAVFAEVVFGRCRIGLCLERM